jgi:hypothetical protein
MEVIGGSGTESQNLDLMIWPYTCMPMPSRSSIQLARQDPIVLDNLSMVRRIQGWDPVLIISQASSVLRP